MSINSHWRVHKRLAKTLRCLACLAAFSGMGAGQAVGNTLPLPGIVQEHVPNAAAVGSGMYSYLFWDLYNATLYAPQGRWQPEQPFALELRYLTDIKGRKIASVSRDEITRQGVYDTATLTTWEKAMAAIFPDVQAGTILTGVRMPDGATVFYNNQQQAGRIADPEFGKAFFNIWLGKTTRDADLRADLLGQQ